MDSEMAQPGVDDDPNANYLEWDKMTDRQQENFEITSDARDYNNADIDDTMSEIHLEETSDHPDAKTRDAYLDPYMRVDGGMASTQSYSLWSNLMPQFAELAHLDYFNTEIKAGRKQYKDFYVYFR